MIRHTLISFCFGFWSLLLIPCYWEYKVTYPDSTQEVAYPDHTHTAIAEGFPFPFICLQLGYQDNSGTHMFNHLNLVLNIFVLWGFWFLIYYLCRIKINFIFNSYKIASSVFLLLLYGYTAYSFYLFIYYFWIGYGFGLDNRLEWFKHGNVELMGISFWR